MASETVSTRFNREFSEGHILFREGDEGSFMYVIHSGRVRLSRKFAMGDQTLAILGPGDFFGEMALLNRRPRSATAIALEPLSALEIDARTLEAMVIGHSEIGVRLITRLSRRVEAANEMVDILMHRDPRVRVVWALARLLDEFGAVEQRNIPLPFTASEIAGTAQVSEAEATELLSRLVRVRVISSTDDGGYTVSGASTLRSFLALLDRDKRVLEGGLPLPPHGAEARGWGP